MNTVEAVKKTAKSSAGTAAGAFFLANPFIGMFLVGLGAAVYFSLRPDRRTI